MFNASEIWEQLLAKSSDDDPGARIYQALGNTAVGVRASVIPVSSTLELLVEVDREWLGTAKLPEWRGMSFDRLRMEIPPRTENHQLVLSLRDEDQKQIFLAFCNDLVTSLEGATNAEKRIGRIEEGILRWGRFFEKCGPEGLSVNRQCGLFGELVWLERLLDTGLETSKAVGAWKGCERDYHDFDLNGRIVEVKTTMSKEPRQIVISNERQLDERGLVSLNLLVLSLRKAMGGGDSLPCKVKTIRKFLKSYPAALLRFEECLINAGYLDQHEQLYKWQFIIAEESLFEVRDGFPRLVDLPDGIGRLTYSVVLSSCRSFEVAMDQYLLESCGAGQ